MWREAFGTALASGRFPHMLATRLTILQFTLLLCLAIILIPAGAHLFELSAKMAMARADYMTVQGIYAGWAWFGVPIFAAMILLLLHAIMMRDNRTSFWLSLAALVLIVISQIIFWTYTFPMNSLTLNWTLPPQDFEASRRQWEYSHAINAGLTLAAYVAGTLAVLTARLRRGQADRND
jgi:Ca2+/Na+ antiporter